MIFLFRIFKNHCLLTVTLLLWGVFSSGPPAQAADDAQYWVDKGLIVSETKPDSDEEAMCYRRALEIDSQHASAHFNLGYVLDVQVSRNWAKKAPVWADLEKLYEAFEHYTVVISVKSADNADACANAIRIAKVLLAPPIKRSPDLHYIYGSILMCLELLEDRSGLNLVIKELYQLKLNIEKQLSALKEEIPSKTLVKADEIEKKLTRSFKRGKSPYKGPRIPLMIQFAYNSSQINSKSSAQLWEMAEALKKNRLSNMKILIEGHTDSDGPLEYNRRLSRKRALSVKLYLEENFGLTASRFEIKAYGESRPLVSNDIDEHKAMNRRVEFVNFQKLEGFREQIVKRKRSGSDDTFDVLY